MKAIKALLAVSVLTAAGAASAAVLPLQATLVSQTPPTGTQSISGDNTFYGEIDVDMTTGLLTGLSITSNGSYVSTSSLGPALTFAAGSTWSAVTNGGVAVTSLDPAGSGWVATYTWGELTQDSNEAGTFSGAAPTFNGHSFCTIAQAGSPGWDHAVLTVNLDAMLQVVDATLVTTEVGAFGNAVTNYSVSAVPLPAAAWLFGSGLIGLAGVVRRRRAAA